MPELRHDPVSGRRVIVAPERDARPHSARTLGTDAAAPDCPFCPGNEHTTPPEVHRTGPGAPDTVGWSVRVVPNLYPIVGPAGEGGRRPRDATGAHEVVVLSPDHLRSFAMLDDDRAVEVAVVLRERTSALLAAGHVAVEVFVNHGKEAGASLAHPHAQVVALDVVPPAAEAALHRFATAEADLVAREIAEVGNGPLSVSGGPAPVWCPYGSGSPYEMRIAHRDAGAGFADATDDQLATVAITLRDSLGRLATIAGDVPYNVILHSVPRATAERAFHWYVEILPRLSIHAGFEMGTGILVNMVAPEVAAARLRDSPPPGSV